MPWHVGHGVKCSCRGFCRWGKCKHFTITSDAFADYVAPVVEPKVTEIEAGQWYIVSHDTQVWLQDGQWMAVGPTANAIEIVESHIAKQQAVAEAEEIVATPVVVTEIEAKPAYTMDPAKLAKFASLSQSGAEQAVTVEEPAAAVKDNVVDIAERGSLNGAQHAASFWAELPSRQKKSA